MHFIENDVYHVFNQGNNRQPVFFKDEDYLLFLRKLRTELAPHCEILCWCLMPNHFHLMLRATDKSCALRPSFGGKPMQVLANKIGIFLSSYTQLINKETGNSGSLFRQKTKAKPALQLRVEQGFRGTLEDYMVYLMHYLHYNPVRAGLVQMMEDWPWSSFRDYAGLRDGSLCQKDVMSLLGGYKPASFYQDSYDAVSKMK